MTVQQIVYVYFKFYKNYIKQERTISSIPLEILVLNLEELRKLITTTLVCGI